MTKLTYTEQLKHPNWQRKRLEMLNAANFECSNCGDKNSMLHVHHRQYFKGRAAWEYDSAELVVLCENCHKGEHKSWDGLKKIISEVGTNELYALDAGFHHHTDWIDRENVFSGRESNPLAYAAGFIAWLAYNLDIGDMDKLAAFAVSMMNDSSEARMVYTHKSCHLFGRGD